MTCLVHTRPGTGLAAAVKADLKAALAVIAAQHALYAITVREPYAWAIAAGHKPVENRTRRVNGEFVGCWLGIHASGEWYDGGERDPRILQAAINAYQANQIDDICTVLGGSGPRRVPARPSTIIALRQLTGCHSAQVDENGVPCCQPWGEPSIDRTIWHLTFGDLAIPLPHPVRTRGYVWVPWRVPEEPAQLVTDQLIMHANLRRPEETTCTT